MRLQYLQSDSTTDLLSTATELLHEVEEVAYELYEEEVETYQEEEEPPEEGDPEDGGGGLVDGVDEAKAGAGRLDSFVFYATAVTAKLSVTVWVSVLVGCWHGLTDGSDLYLCFIADTPDAQAERQAALIAEIEGAPVAASVPNSPLICLLTQ